MGREDEGRASKRKVVQPPLPPAARELFEQLEPALPHVMQGINSATRCLAAAWRAGVRAFVGALRRWRGPRLLPSQHDAVGRQLQQLG